MSSSNPPYPNFNGITYNSSFFPTTTSGGLTQTQANLLYLKKTVADTAIAAETFSGGITVSTSANINPLLNAAGGVASSNYDSSGASVIINLGTAQTSGVLNIGTGNRTTALAGGGINIGSSLGTNPITIDTSSVLNSNATPAISIGASTSVKTVKINNPTNSVHCSSIELKGSNINHIVPNSTSGIIIGDGQTDSTTGLLIGCSSAGNVRTLAPIKIGNDSTFTGTITLGGSSTNINLNGTTNAGALRTGSLDNSGALVIGATATPLTVGNASSTTSMLGATSISNLKTTSVDTASTVQLSIAPTTASSLVLGNLTTCNTSNLGTFTSTGAVIANGGIKSTNIEPTSVSSTLDIAGTITTGTLNIGATQTTGTLNIGTGVRNITSSGGVINIGTGSSAVINPINIGGTGSAINLIGTTTLSKPLTLGSIPNASTQLGFLYSASVNNIASSASPWTILSIPILTAGIYIFALEVQSAYGTIAQFQIELTGVNVPQSNFGKSDLLIGSVLTSSGTVIVNCTVSTYTMKITYSATLSSVYANMNAVRIA